MKPRAICFHLPQFHPIPENDAWWGKGFTEWTNVVRSTPRFKGHYQPHLPADLGFYDLRLPEARQAQAELAKQYGIHGFCYYHYWFNGQRILERPVKEILASGEPDFPFCLCWANENWTRRWDGQDEEVLLRQNYCDDDDKAHIALLVGAFRDPRYIRVDDKPLFLIYRASHLPDPARTAALWRKETTKYGIGEIFLASVQSLPTEHVDPTDWGFDATVEFAPDWMHLPTPIGRGRLVRRLRRLLTILRGQASPFLQNYVGDYSEMATEMEKKPDPTYLRFPCVTPGWDNSARRKTGATILSGSTPERYEQWLANTIRRVQAKPKQHQLVFINAWNEWAEGNHLEPCQHWRLSYLEATRNALIGNGL